MNKSTATFISLLTGLIILSTASADKNNLPTTSHPATDVYDGWQLGIQARSFNRFTFYEAVEKTASLGLDWIEAYPGQTLSKENPKLKFDHNMSLEIRKQVKQKLENEGVKPINYGVVGLPNDEAQCRKVFDFAKDMGIVTIVSEPPENAFDLVDKLCKEYKIKVAIHNHPKPSRYFNPDTVLEVCKNRSNWIGACADTGHWMRSGIDPLEAIKKLEGRIISLHFKDLNESNNPAAHDTIWGSGKADIKAILEELHKQNFKGVFAVEYEYNWTNSLPDIAQCIAYFDKIAAKLKPAGWQNLFEPDLSNALFATGSWQLKDGILTADRDEIIWTKQKFDNFILDLEFKLSEGTNSGVFVRCGDIVNWLHTSIEIQILDSYGKQNPTRHDCGSVYDCLAPSKNSVKKPGQWNHYTITCKDNKIYTVLNGIQILDMDLDKWTEPNKNPDGTKNKFNTALKDMPRSGFVGLQGKHGGKPIQFRNMKIKKLTH